MDTTTTYTLKIEAKHPADWSTEDVHDVLRWALDTLAGGALTTLSQSDLPDLSAIVLTSTRIRRGTVARLQPGDMAEHRTRDLDPREVVAVGRDWVTLDIMGRESPRVAMDNYEQGAPAEGAL